MSGKKLLVDTFGIVEECRKNPVIHVHPNWASPIRWVVLCVAFHVQGTEE